MEESWRGHYSLSVVLLMGGASALLFVLGPALFGAVEPWSIGILASFAFLATATTAATPSLCTISPRQWILTLGLLMPVAIHLMAPSGHNPEISLSEKLLPALPWLAAAACSAACAATFAIPPIRQCFPWVIFLSGVILAVLGLAQRGQGNHFIYGFRAVPLFANPFGPFYNHNHAAAFLTPSLFAGIGLIFAQAAIRRESLEPAQGSEYWPKQLLLIFFVGIITWGLFSIGSRANQLAIGISAALWICIAKPFKSLGLRTSLAAMILLFGVLALFRQGPWAPSRPGVLSPHDSTTLRASIYRSSAVMLQDAPWTGSGLGSYPDRFRLYREPQFPGRNDHAHSDWLMLAAELGIPTALALLAVFVGLTFPALSCPRASIPDDFASSAVAAGIFAVLLHTILDCIIWVPGLLAPFTIATTWLCAPHAIEGTSPRHGSHRPARTIIATLGLAGLLISTRPLVAESHLERARSGDRSTQPHHLQSAYTWMPTPANSLRVAGSYLALARENPPAARILMRQALGAAHTGTRKFPRNPQLLRLCWSILHHMGRATDAQLCARDAALLDPLGK